MAAGSDPGVRAWNGLQLAGRTNRTPARYAAAMGAPGGTILQGDSVMRTEKSDNVSGEGGSGRK